MTSPSPDESRPPRLRIDISCPDHATVVVTPSGEADIYDVARLEQAVSDAIRENRPHVVVVDLDQVTFMDASTLGVLVCARRRTSAAGNTLRVSCRTGPNRRLLTMTGLEGMLDPSA